MVVRAGEPLDLSAITVVPFGVPGEPRLTYTWRFGDRDTSPPLREQTVSHTYRAPGVYTILVVATDGTGVRSFGLTRIRVATA